MARRRPVDPSPATGERPRIPRRDGQGRIARFGELLLVVVGLLGFGVAALLGVDGVFWLLGGPGFGDVSGWLAGIPVVWLFVEDVRAWHGLRGRVGVLLVALAVAFPAGFAVGGAVRDLPDLPGGALAVTTAALAYAPLWFFGVRWLDRQVG